MMSNVNCEEEQHQATISCASRSSSSQMSDNFQFHIIKLEDLPRSRNRYPTQNIDTNVNVRLTTNLPGQIGLDLPTRGIGSTVETQTGNTLYHSSVIRFKSKPKCPMCHGSSAAYYCADCVRNGNFYHSSLKLPERFAEKRFRERRLRQYIASVEERAPEEMAPLFKRENLKREIEDLKERIELIKKVVETERKIIKKAKEEETGLKAQIFQLRKTNPMFQTKNGQILQNISLYTERIPEKRGRIGDLETIFKLMVRNQIDELTSNIFPVGKIMPDTREECLDSLNEETVKELAEASQTLYVRGRWITTAHFAQETNYNILSLTLPGSGDYVSFIRPQTGTEICEKKEAHNICAGLTYLCQMVNLLAFYLGIHLPKKIAFSDFSDFSRQEMGERKFQNLVSRLNQNVIYLCVSQGVPPDFLHPLRALPNIVALLTEGQAEPGRSGSFEFPDSIIDNMEVVGCYEDVADSDSDDDWETINHTPLPEFSPPTPSGAFFRRTSVDDTASGIVTSAAASVMSIFKGISNPMK